MSHTAQVGLLKDALEELKAVHRRSWWDRLVGRLSRKHRPSELCEVIARLVEELDRRNRALEAVVRQQQGTLEALNQTLIVHHQSLADWERKHDDLNELSAQVSALAAHATAAQSESAKARDEVNDQLSKTDTRLDAIAKETEQLTASYRTIPPQFASLMVELGSIREKYSRLSDSYTEIGSIVQRESSANAAMLAELKIQQSSAVSDLKLMLRERGPDSPEQFGKFYLAFEDRFRGSREDIAQRLSIYVPHVTAAIQRCGNKMWVDLGCGRGEWLEILRNGGAESLGVDNNTAMLEACQQRGLSVVDDDALDFLNRTAANSIAGISAFHLIEHLPYRTMLALFHAAFRALAPGGCLILETPNPQNVSVGACNFYMDVTHQKPIPPMTAEFIAQHIGFKTVEVVRLHPSDRHAERDLLPTVTDREYCEMFYGPRDYAIIAVK